MSSIIPKQFNYFSSRPYFGFQIDGILDYTSAGDLVLKVNLNSLRRKNKAAVNLKTGRFDNINSAVIISSVCKAVLSKRPVLRLTAALFFLLKLFSSHIYCIPNLNRFLRVMVLPRRYNLVTYWPMYKVE